MKPKFYLTEVKEKGVYSKMKKIGTLLVFFTLIFFCGFMSAPASAPAPSPEPESAIVAEAATYSSEYVSANQRGNELFLRFNADCDIIISIEAGKVVSIQTTPFGEAEFPRGQAKPVPRINVHGTTMSVALNEDGELFMGVENLGAGFSAGTIGFYN